MTIETIRTWQFQRMELATRTVEALCSLAEPDALVSLRDGDDGWSVTQVLGHLRDFERLFLERATLTITQENPPLPFPDPDELAAQNAYQQTPWTQHLQDWQSARLDLLTFLRNRTETDWERIAQHPTRGVFTLHDQLFLTTLHDCIHLEQITRILSGK